MELSPKQQCEMALSYKQKQSIAVKYMKDRGITFGNAMADERAEQMFIDALSYKEEMYEHTINQFKESWLIILRSTWDEMYKYLNKK